MGSPRNYRAGRKYRAYFEWGLLSSIWKNVDDRIYRLTVRVRLFFPGHSEYLTWKILENLLKLLIFQVLKSKILVFWKRDVSIQNDKVTENILRCSPNILRRLKIKLWNQLTKNLIPYFTLFWLASTVRMILRVQDSARVLIFSWFRNWSLFNWSEK